MELASSSHTALNITTEVELINYTYAGSAPKEVIARIDLGDGVNGLSGSGGIYTVRVYLNTRLMVPNSDITVPSGQTQISMPSRSIPIRTNDVVSITVISPVADTSVNTFTTLRDATPISESQVSGGGDTVVDHNYGGTDALAYVDQFAVGIDNASIKVYLKTDYDVGNLSDPYVIGTSTTTTNGRWIRPVMLDPGTYIIVFYKQGIFGPDRRTVVIAV